MIPEKITQIRVISPSYHSKRGEVITQASKLNFSSPKPENLYGTCISHFPHVQRNERGWSEERVRVNEENGERNDTGRRAWDQTGKTQRTGRTQRGKRWRQARGKAHPPCLKILMKIFPWRENDLNMGHQELCWIRAVVNLQEEINTWCSVSLESLHLIHSSCLRLATLVVPRVNKLLLNYVRLPDLCLTLCR